MLDEAWKHLGAPTIDAAKVKNLTRREGKKSQPQGSEEQAYRGFI